MYKKILCISGLVMCLGIMTMATTLNAQDISNEQDSIFEEMTPVNISDENIIEKETQTNHGIVLLDTKPLNDVADLIEKEEAIEEMPQVVEAPQKSLSDVLIVGDSRTVGMQAVMDPKIKVIAKVGKGYSWMTQTVGDQIKEELKTHSVLVFNLGVNDLANINKYIAYLQDIQMQYPSVHIYCCTVGPVGNTTVTNEDINMFNDKISQSGFDIIDVNAKLIEKGFSSPDGLHYTKNTYQTIYDEIIKKAIE